MTTASILATAARLPDPMTGETVDQAYNRLYTEATALSANITESLINDKFPTSLHWGHVGDTAALTELLRQVSDMRFQEGEYAE